MSNISVNEETIKETYILIPKEQLIEALAQTIDALNPSRSLGNKAEYVLEAFSEKVILTDITGIKFKMTQRSSI
jgi:hypothetical protein|tara:strand:+ start:189 stop:410 length:222 start_codon:yes stop_codon:yes gene_type:complete